MIRTLRAHIILWAIGIATALSGLGVAHAEGNTLQSVNVAQGNGDGLVVKVTLRDAPASAPVHFATTNPNRIVVDFPNTLSAAGRLTETVNQGAVKTYNVMQAGDRTRLVLNLTGAATYQVRQSGNQVLVVVQGEKAAAEAAPATSFAEAGPKREHSIRDVEFKRGKSGEGRIIVTLSDPGVGIDIRQKGSSVLVDFANTELPAILQRRMDVRDFATPTQMIETTGQGKNVRMKVDAQGKWDYSAYQSGEQFIIDFRSLDDPRQAAADKPQYSGEKLTLNFQNVGVREVLQVIADFTSLNIIASDTVTGNITLRLKDVPWDQALDIILRAKGLDKRASGNVIWVAPRDELAAKEKLELEARQQISDLEDMRIEVIKLNYLRANEAYAILNGQSVAQAQTSEKVSCSAQAEGVGGQAAQTQQASGGAGAQRVLSKRGTVTYDLKTNTLFVQDTPTKLEEIHGLLQSIDVPTKQVMIEARVVVADDGFNRDLGVKLGARAASTTNKYGYGISGSANDSASVANSGTVATTGPFNVDLGAGLIGATNPATIGFTILEKALGHIITLELSALEADNRGKIVSNPRVITQNQKPAVILQGTQLPNVTPGTANSPATVSFKDAFLCLLVDPQILNNEDIVLNVEVQKDAPGEPISLGAGGGVAYPIETKRVKTQVRVRNGETAVLGGIFEQTVRNDTTKVPLFGDIPVVGSLFRNNTKQDEKTELLIFLTPRVLDSNLNLR